MRRSREPGVRSENRKLDRRRHPHVSGRMTAEQRDRLIRVINDPPPGSQLYAAKENGIDLTLVLRQLELTPTERLEKLLEAQSIIEELRRRADATVPEKGEKESRQSHRKREGQT